MVNDCRKFKPFRLLNFIVFRLEFLQKGNQLIYQNSSWKSKKRSHRLIHDYIRIIYDAMANSHRVDVVIS